MAIKTKMGTISKGLFFVVVCLILGFLISFVYAQFTFKTKDAGGTLQNRFIVNQGAAKVEIDILNADLDMNSNTIKNVANPVNPQDAANKNYVDTTVGSQAHVPSGAIIFFPPNLSCPTGYTDITLTYDDKVPLLCNGCTGITTGGTTSHTHTIPDHSHGGNTGITNISHSHTVSSGWAGALHASYGHGSGTYYCFGTSNPASSSTAAADPSHSHSIAVASLTSNTPSNGYPPYFTVRACRKN